GGSLLTSTSFGLLGAVFRAALVAAVDARCVERSTDDVIADTRQILHTAAANEHDRVLLQVVAFAGDVGGDFEPVGQTHTCHFAERRVGLLGSGGVNAGADATLLGIGLERGRLFLLLNVAAALTNELIDCRH